MKAVMLWIFIAHKSPSSLVRFEPMNLGSSGKLDIHQTTNNDKLLLNIVCQLHVGFITNLCVFKVLIRKK
jgi:hypothetical protein